MFQSATVRLTTIYVGILFCICLIFNIALYQVLAHELTRNFSIQNDFFVNRPRFESFIRDPEALKFRNEQLRGGKRHIMLQLFYIDLALLGAGGVASYYLARRTLRPIEESHDAQIRFASDASHELRTPLAAMQTEIEVALRDPRLKLSESKELLNSNLEEVATLRQLTDGLLTLARTDLPNTAIESVALRPILSAAVARVQKSLDATNTELILDVGKKVTARIDSLQLTEVVVILLDNAVKYRAKNPKITLSARIRKDHTELIIADNGVGIAKADLERVFERFYRADTARTKSSTNGHGLGLSIARRLVEQNNGELTLTSTKGKGTTAILTLRS
jgi:two-component system sensor histidine kinase CiaH